MWMSLALSAIACMSRWLRSSTTLLSLAASLSVCVVFAFAGSRDAGKVLGSVFLIAVGAALARLEGRVVLEALTERFSTVEVAGTVDRTPSGIIAGVHRAELRFG